MSLLQLNISDVMQCIIDTHFFPDHLSGAGFFTVFQNVAIVTYGLIH